ncbi:MAG: methyltransferase domain-containing protein [Planctomycetia bacterium]|nr:methyltransferase domain-containing protein [Planctomycetia bacterium]
MEFNVLKTSSSETVISFDSIAPHKEDNYSRIGTKIISRILAGYSGEIAVELWDGTLVHGKHNAPCTIIFKAPCALRDLVLHRNILRLAECYLTNTIEVEGDLEALFSFKTYLTKLNLPFMTNVFLLTQALRLPSQGHYNFIKNWCEKFSSHRNSRNSIAHHYDVSNDFYSLWLDPEMVYSCAYFRDKNQSLAAAQRDKLDYLCRKLRLQPGHTLLDIGCGWGALAIYAARKYGVTVHGITLSEAQQEHALQRVRAEGLEHQVNIELLDYRDLSMDAEYDRVVSVGMFEHIGVRNFPVYFGTVKRVLKPGGLFLNHGITSDTAWQHTPMTRFINRYIFPDGELARISDVADAMEKAGFELLDTEGLRRHYAYTLRHWVKALEENCEEAIQKTSEITYRLWRLYMAGSAHYFEEGSIGVYQLLVGHQRNNLTIPLRRDDLYSDQGLDVIVN